LLAVGDSLLACADRQAPCVLRLNGDAVAFARAVVSVALCDSAVVVVDAEGWKCEPHTRHNRFL
jgi:hypothetical protein